MPPRSAWRSELCAQRAQGVRVEARGGLVEQEDVRLGQQRGGEREATARPERAGADLALGDGFEAGAGERLVGVAAARSARREGELVARGPPGMEAVAVEDAAHAPGRLRSPGGRPR